ncbi:hypothetical protein ACQP00_19070 [Dactylosporangium sp. CS-047395]|uniref:hypothetical protein n=1 Tax=Dactylosporangium sp. CS-047395 TaxID=3239936 RepID=UPI003D90B154
MPTEDLVPSATATGPHLGELAERDRAIEFGTSSECMAWDDEAVRRTLRAAAAALAALG